MAGPGSTLPGGRRPRATATLGGDPRIAPQDRAILTRVVEGNWSAAPVSPFDAGSSEPAVGFLVNQAGGASLARTRAASGNVCALDHFL